MIRVRVYLPAHVAAELARRCAAARAAGATASPQRWIAAAVARQVARLEAAEARQRGELIQRWWGLLQGLVRKAAVWSEGAVAEDELLAVALQAADRAALRYDPAKAPVFGPYLKQWVWPELRRTVVDAWERKHQDVDLDHAADLAAPAPDDHQQELLQTLAAWAGDAPSRRRALEQVAAAGSLAVLGPGLQRSLRQHLAAQDLQLAAPRPGISAAAAARQLGVGDGQIRKLCRAGRLRAWRTPRGWQVDPDSLAQLRTA